MSSNREELAHMGQRNVSNLLMLRVEALEDSLEDMRRGLADRGVFAHVGSTPAIDTVDASASLPTVIALANAIRTAYEAHRVDVTAHDAADSTNTIAAPAATDQASSNTLLNELQTDLNAHMALAASHQASGRPRLGGAGGLAATAADATTVATDLTTSFALANSLKRTFNRHAAGIRQHNIVAS